MQNAYAFEAVALASTFFQVACYIIVSRRVKSWFNFTSIPMLSSIIANGVLSYLGLTTAGPAGSFFAYSFCQITYSAVAGAMAIGTFLPVPRLQPLHILERKTEYPAEVPWLLFALAVIVFAPVLIAFRGSLADPRYIYEQTRTGYGLSYFLSTTLTIMAWSSHLFTHRKWWQTAIFFSLCAELVYLHGSKGQIVSLLVVYLLFRVYVLGKGVTLRQFGPLIAAGTVVLATSIILFSADTIGYSDVLGWSVGYADYTHNAMVVIDNPTLFSTPRYGELTFEDEFYSRVPRILDPGKPKDFGAFKLAAIYYPSNFESDAGTASFGIGLQYADFGILSLPLLFFWTVGTTWATLGVIRRTRLHPTPGMFLLLAFLSGVVLIPSGIGYLLPEAIILGYGTNLIFKYWGPFRSMIGIGSKRVRPGGAVQIQAATLSTRP